MDVGAVANQNFTLVIGTAATVGTPVPEPSTWAMMLLGFAGLGFMGYQSAGRRRRTARSAYDPEARGCPAPVASENRRSLLA